MTHPLVNFLAFYVVWGASAWGAANAHPWAGPLVLLAWLVPHLAASGARWACEARLLLVAGATGYGVDSALVLGGWLDFPQEARLGAPSTLWMVGLWVGFAATLRHSFRVVLGRPVLSVVLGALGGPAAYWAGERLGAVSLGEGALIAIGLAWALAMPWLAWVAGHGRVAELPRRDLGGESVPRALAAAGRGTREAAGTAASAPRRPEEAGQA